MSDNTALIDALLRERRGYETYGLKDRVAAVDAELARLGHTPAARAKPKAQPERAVRPPTEKRAHR